MSEIQMERKVSEHPSAFYEYFTRKLQALPIAVFHFPREKVTLSVSGIKSTVQTVIRVQANDTS